MMIWKTQSLIYDGDEEDAVSANLLSDSGLNGSLIMLENTTPKHNIWPNSGGGAKLAN